MWKSILSITIGATLGSLLRWFLGLKMNNLFPTIPPGTLVANLIGCYIIGFAIAYFASIPNIAAEWRLFIITGFCGGLTTFSTYAAEIVALLREERFAWSLGAIVIHTGCSLLLTIAGIASWFCVERLLR